MHSLSLVALLLVCASCGPSGPVYRGLRVDLSVRAPVRVAADARVQARVQAPAQAEVQVEVPAPTQAEVQVEVPAPTQTEVQVEVPAPLPPPPSAVALEGAPVVEFFGVPLDGVQDVVFVLDRSGSMSEPALGRIARIAAVAPTDQTAAPLPDDPSAEHPGGQPADPSTEHPADPSTDQPANPSADPSTGPPGDPAVQPSVVTIVPRKIDVAQAELIDALERLPAGTRMNVVFFNNGVQAAAPGLVPLEESNRAELIQFVRETIPDGRTALAPAMRTAFLMNARHVILLSDGLGNLGGDAQDVIRDAREAMRGGARIDTVGLGGNQDTRLLQILARESGGLYQPL